MGLNITVQKGHDFSSGNVTRAALNAGATPTIAVTGSISGTELADSSVTNAKIDNNANIAVSKLNVPTGNLILGANSVGSALAPQGEENNPTDGKELLVNTGTGFALKGTSTAGDVSVSYNTSAEALQFDIKTEQIEGSHLSDDISDQASIGKNNSGKLSILNGGVHWDKLYNFKNSAGNTRAAFLSYGASGIATPTEITEANQVLVSTGSNANSEAKSFFKEVEILSELTAETKWYRKEHGLTNADGTASVVPKFVKVMMVCKGETQQATHKYSINDVIDIGHEWVDHDNNASALLGVSYDATHIIVNYLGGSLADFGQLPKKYGGNTTASTTSGTTAAFTLSDNNSYQDFKLIAYVCG